MRDGQPCDDDVLKLDGFLTLIARDELRVFPSTLHGKKVWMDMNNPGTWLKLSQIFI